MNPHGYHNRRREAVLAEAKGLQVSVTAWANDMTALHRRLTEIDRKLDEVLLHTRRAPKRKLDSEARHLESVDVTRIYEHWVKVTGRNPNRTQLTPERRAKIKARLKEGYDVKRQTRAIDGCVGSDFHMGRGQYVGKGFNDLTLICRNGSKLEEFEAMPAARDEGERKAKFLGAA